MKLEMLSAATRHELMEVVNKFVIEKVPDIKWEPKVFFVPYRKKWYCVMWYE